MQRQQQPCPALQVGQRSLHHRHPAPIARGGPFGLAGGPVAGPSRSLGCIAPSPGVSARRACALRWRIGLDELQKILGTNADPCSKRLHKLHAQGGRRQRQQQGPGFGLKAGTALGGRQVDP